MVELMRSAIALFGGMMVYMAIPAVVGGTSNMALRNKIGTRYGKMAARSLGQFAFVRRVLSGYDVKEIKVDDEQKLLKTTLSSSTLGDDQEYPFKDPDNRVKRLWGKPMCINYEEVPAALDAELSELGHWVREKALNEGFIDRTMAEGATAGKDHAQGKVDPWVKMDDTPRLVDPIDAYELVPNAVEPENIKSAEAHTAQRFSKYGSKVSAAETVGMISGFITGVGGYAGAQYVRNELIGGSAGGGTIESPVVMIDFATQAVVMMV